MAISHLEFFAESLGMRTRVNVVLPEHPAEDLSVLLLLHGLSDDENVWLEQTKLAAYASNKQVAIIMPRVDRSYYTNEVNGSHYFDYLTELLQRCRQWFNLTIKPSRTFVAGVSMGGFGALKVALNQPEEFSKAYLLSAMVDIQASWRAHPDRDAWYRSLFGSPAALQGTENDLTGLIKHWSAAIRRPAIMQICGDHDPFYEINQQLHQDLLANQFDNDLEIVPGAHEWRVWDSAIQTVLSDIDEKIN
ncbi:alpha/beta hydrolase [Lapidilactobacillus wuchangensis]|uniref:alpha/beta hydrolase n=1 Tax=Lapidilactobacillus wuchangensis TaxID=2486001 RepID=UPI000F7B7BC9|nr:alpha/beta hydrolase-fold protein [Lapidilactobacillus wuchangensis]